MLAPSLNSHPLSSPLLPLASTCGYMPLPWHGPVPAQRMALLDEEMIRSDVINPPSVLECIQNLRMRKLISDLCVNLCLTFSICPFPSSCEQLNRKAIRQLMAVRRKTRPAPSLLFLTLPQSVNRLCQKVHPPKPRRRGSERCVRILSYSCFARALLTKPDVLP